MFELFALTGEALSWLNAGSDAVEARGEKVCPANLRGEPGTVVCRPIQSTTYIIDIGNYYRLDY
jgi:hypothetical protein